ncbi:pseudouridine synthase [Dactylonectria macrodidyma]|uniref:tRNA pseudouridine(55) synthase n=1 Tax=Dactylonectria macrodidyma TaxID=307937 RepID=A0A9P9FL13_9HYPO|nr:pseudouridine synthase [Dactylonectria macrodidyma]
MKPRSIKLNMAADILREGVFAINKPRGHSSAQVIRECQKVFNPSQFFKPSIDAEIAKRFKENSEQFNRRKAIKRGSQVKIGHGGTLDPLATGVLILGVGSATKQLNQFLQCTKEYETIILFGASTDTYDRAGRILSKRPYDHITREMVEKEVAGMLGPQVQIPPLYSALKMNGKPLYEYAREGKPIPREIEGRNVEVQELEILEWYEPGTHNFRWPTEEAEAAERNLAEQVWRVKKQQESGNKKLSPEEKEQEDQAIAAHESFKRKFEQRQDELIKDAPSKRSQKSKKPPLMSGALGKLPEKPIYLEKGLNLVPDVPDKDTPPPWTDKGPPAVKVRLTVTSGFYIRSFCHDLGAKLESAALMSELCRSRQSDFTVGGTNCLEYDDLAKGESVWGPQVADMLARWNGEPSGKWPGTQADSPLATTVSKLRQVFEVKSPQSIKRDEDSKNGQSSPPPFPPKGEKRRRSASPNGSGSPPRKAAALEVNQTPAKKGSQARSDDEKSWNGFDD